MADIILSKADKHNVCLSPGFKHGFETRLCLLMAQLRSFTKENGGSEEPPIPI